MKKLFLLLGLCSALFIGCQAADTTETAADAEPTTEETADGTADADATTETATEDDTTADADATQ